MNCTNCNTPAVPAENQTCFQCPQCDGPFFEVALGGLMKCASWSAPERSKGCGWLGRAPVTLIDGLCHRCAAEALGHERLAHFRSVQEEREHCMTLHKEKEQLQAACAEKDAALAAADEEFADAPHPQDGGSGRIAVLRAQLKNARSNTAGQGWLPPHEAKKLRDSVEMKFQFYNSSLARFKEVAEQERNLKIEAWEQINQLQAQAAAMRDAMQRVLKTAKAMPGL